MEIGLHGSHEQFPPSRLLGLARLADQAGIEAMLCSDHLAPWSEQQGHSGYAWTWLGAAAAATELDLAVVTAPGYRYHPAVVAQAIATVAELAPGRFTPALGSGQALNEHVTGGHWPTKPERNARLAECAGVIGRLLAGEEVDHDGLVRVRQARIYSRPQIAPPLYAAALSPETAREVAGWADGLITVNAPHEQLRRLLDAFADGGGEGKPVHLQLHLSWADSEQSAREQALQQWRTNALPPILNEELDLPTQLDAASTGLTADDLTDSVLMTSDLGRLTEALAGYADLGIDRVYLHQVGPDQERFVEVLAEQIRPRLR